MKRRARLRAWQLLRRSSVPIRIMLSVTVFLSLAIGVNWVYQVVRKPSELFFPVSGALYKTPTETWAEYAPLFIKHATPIITPDFLAALAQTEGSGNPLVRTYWRWSWTLQPFEIYRPASSAVGMYQITDGTFAQARRYCIHDHSVAEEGSWNQWHSCWFNSFYARVVPANAVELTAAYLDRGVAATLERHGVRVASLRHKQALAAVIHLCGAGTGDVYARRGFRLSEGQRCGDHTVSAYIAHLETLKRVFDRIARQ